jgi:hypothetical protein
MLQMQKEKAAQEALRATIQRWFDAAALDQINIHSSIDHTGEPAIFVNVHLKAAKNRLAPDKSVDLQIALRDALQDLNDDRFPYLAFSAPDDDVALSDERKSA